MAAAAGRIILGAVGAVTSMEVYKQLSKTTMVAPTPVIQSRGFLQAVLELPTSVKIAVPTLTVGSLALIYCLARNKEVEEEELPPIIPITVNLDKLEESLVTGSDLSERPIPACQGLVARKVLKGKEEVFEVVGCCIRTTYGIWVPAHVLGSEPEKLFILGKKVSRTNKAGETEYYVPSISLKPYYDKIMDTEQFGAEIINIPYDKDFSVLGLAIAKMTNLGHKQLVTIVGPQGKSSMGDLTPGALLGSVKYGGSTMAGFSGAPYMVNGRVVGIHLHGGAGGNGGQEIFYLNQLYKIEHKIEEESAGAGMDTGAKVLSLAFKRRKELRHEVFEDFVVFRDDSGHYHRVKKATFFEQKEKYVNQDLDFVEDSDSDYSHYGMDPDEYDRAWKRGKYAEQGKFPKYRAESSFLSQGSYKLAKRKPTPRVWTHAERTQRRIEKLKRRLATLENGQKPAVCPPQIQPQQGPSTALGSNSLEGQK